MKSRWRTGVLSFVVLCLGLPDIFARGPSWKPEREPGSSQMAWSAVAYLVLPDAPDVRLEAAVTDFLQVAADRGWAFEVLGRTEPEPKRAIILERFGERSGRPRLGHDGFLLWRERTRLRIRADEDAGLANALYTLAGESLGARWYWPDPLGYELVGAPVDKVPNGPLRVRPSFVQRTLHPVNTDYGRRNRLNRKYVFNHNLARIFNTEVFEAAPEAFARIDGRRRSPRMSAKYDPQPDFTSAAAVEIAAEAARAHFDAHPDASSFSLSINDNSLFDEGPATQAAVSPVAYFRELPNYTDLVFGYMNAVAEAVFADPAYGQTASGEPRYLTALAYYWTEQSPSFPVHPRVMPVLTSDRAQWQDSGYRAEDRALIRRWAQSGAGRIATWDYYFGSPYPYPRQFNRWIAESLPYLSGQGVDVFFSQLPSLWGLDGAKAWLAAELLWDARQDAEALLEDYYQNFFGAAAAPMRSFYETAEARRDLTEGAPKWIKFYKDEAGIELFDRATLQSMRASLDVAAALVAGDPRRAARVAIVSGAFDYTEAYFDYQAARRALVEIALGVREGAADPAAAWQAWVDARAQVTALRTALGQQPMHQSLGYLERVFQSDPGPLFFASVPAETLLDATIDWSEADAVALSAVRDWQSGKLLATPLNSNPGLAHSGVVRRNFLGPDLPELSGWRLSYRPSEQLEISAAAGATGQGLRISGADIVSLQQTIPVLAERTYLLEIDAGWRASPDNRTWVQLTWEDFSGGSLRNEVPLQLPSSPDGGSGRWRFIVQSPVNAHDLKLRITANRQYDGDFVELRRIDFGALIPARVD